MVWRAVCTRPGTYSPRQADPRLLAIPTSCSRVADYNPDYDRLSGIGSPSRVGNPLYRPLYYVWSPGHKGHEDLTSSPPSSGLSPAVPLKCPTKWWQLMARVALVAGLNPTSHDTSWRQPCSTCVTVLFRALEHLCSIRYMSRPGKVFRVASN